MGDSVHEFVPLAEFYQNEQKHGSSFLSTLLASCNSDLIKVTNVPSSDACIVLHNDANKPRCPELAQLLRRLTRRNLHIDRLLALLLIGDPDWNVAMIDRRLRSLL